MNQEPPAKWGVVDWVTLGSLVILGFFVLWYIEASPLTAAVFIAAAIGVGLAIRLIRLGLRITTANDRPGLVAENRRGRRLLAIGIATLGVVTAGAAMILSANKVMAGFGLASMIGAVLIQVASAWTDRRR